ncbi:MAG: type I-C CRISPR-associated protein Cas8c/Csd1, partial [Dehalococcoidia bacterium]|nr:type I-C CRISPR-associated protein Cas8c/Csd1 [Dehalococcoidia bacterium]
TDPDPTQVRTLIDSVRRGTAPVQLDDEAFYAASLSGSGGRAVVRDWIDTTVGEARRHAARWFRLQEIVDAYGAPHRPLGLPALAFGTVRRPADLPVTTPRALFRAALTGTPLPLELAFEAVRRNFAERGVDRQRAALIKLVLLSQSAPPTEDYMIALEPDHPSVAYQCGRLLAVLEEVQRAALPGVNASIIDRFYGTASSAPSGVFGRLIRGAQPHFARLERDRRGAYVALQRRMEEVCGRIPQFPRVLTLEEQAIFSLGYYHQRAADRADAASRRAASTASESTHDEKEEN